MSKRICAILMSLIITTSLIGCIGIDSNKAEDNNNAKAVTEAKNSDENLQGSWAEDYSLEKTKGYFKDYLSKMEKVTEELGMKYSKEDVVKENDGNTISVNSIYFDNEKPDPNKIESMYFGMKVFGEDLSSGEIELKLSLNFDSAEAIKSGNFDLGNTSFNKYIAAFTGQSSRNYSEINKQIIDGLKSEKGEGIIENSIDGLKEEIRFNKNYIVYKLSTKTYNFKDPNPTLENNN
ncbi:MULTISPECIES: hypothetical protein [Clostridium]|uniref:Lipoprotein n=1 Tax=Clostridium aquiflavi TaxID=3073603 RepID=A0ABU1ECS8_9CLOT|nr:MULTISPECIES: hypothetical protein [unclassified Clostridium]MDR5586165.1 hypothetical protein [Clostridium sp. 5N-1]NFG61205.1 hypothetical protein [Clostridium botulinum]NFQ08951.1 hypothetical protein [Clostridium botulinum]